MNHDGAVIPFEMNSKEAMQLTKVIYLKYMLKASLQRVNHIHIARQNDEVVYIYDYDHNIMASL
jgi:hypothetical protein